MTKACPLISCPALMGFFQICFANTTAGAFSFYNIDARLSRLQVKKFIDLNLDHVCMIPCPGDKHPPALLLAF